MPLYDYECNDCAHRQMDIIKTYEDKQIDCNVCPGTARRIVTVAHTFGDFAPYIDEHIGPEPIYIKGKAHRREVMKQTGVQEKLGKDWDSTFR